MDAQGNEHLCYYLKGQMEEKWDVSRSVMLQLLTMKGHFHNFHNKTFRSSPILSVDRPNMDWIFISKHCS